MFDSTALTLRLATAAMPWLDRPSAMCPRMSCSRSISEDAVSGIDEAASEFDGLDISGAVSKALFDQLQAALADALGADPVLIIVPAAADAVPSEVAADDAAAIDVETAADAAVDVDASDVLVDLFIVAII